MSSSKFIIKVVTPIAAEVLPGAAAVKAAEVISGVKNQEENANRQETLLGVKIYLLNLTELVKDIRETSVNSNIVSQTSKSSILESTKHANFVKSKGLLVENIDNFDAAFDKVSSIFETWGDPFIAFYNLAGIFENENFGADFTALNWFAFSVR